MVSSKILLPALLLAAHAAAVAADPVRADFEGLTVNVGGIRDDVAVGDYVIVHVGYALQKLDPDEADETLALFARSGLSEAPAG